ncbi:Serine/threonine-protein kinase TOR1 [Talaromyces islandicus]|uniref:Serine/threonine-protein kinase TOR1 n=1 Tax=Talaromyces islandicus TaxID=28573 RepID=A0A0U1LKW4_TALIS|nr:Serine/threonine-protein kinase TOR1 [Talaromyces islandicus]
MRATLVALIPFIVAATAAVGPSPSEGNDSKPSVSELQDKYPDSDIACCKNTEEIKGDGILGNLLAKGALNNLLGVGDSACAKTSLIENLNILGFTEKGSEGVSCTGTPAYCPHGEEMRGRDAAGSRTAIFVYDKIEVTDVAMLYDAQIFPKLDGDSKDAAWNPPLGAKSIRQVCETQEKPEQLLSKMLAATLHGWDVVVAAELEKWKVPGLAVSVVHNGDSWSKAYGVAELPDKPLTTDSLFMACSTTKAFTAAATALVIQDTKSSEAPLKWDTPVSSVIRDDFVLADPHATANTTFEDALSHRTGLPDHFPRIQLAKPRENIRDAVRTLRHLPLAYAPRTTWDYNNHMFITISYALEQKTGEELGLFLKRRIWEPLGMRDTYFNVQQVKKTPGLKDRLVRGYEWVKEQGRHLSQPDINYAPIEGTGAIVSTVLEYEKWIKALLTRSTPMTQEGHDAVFHPRTILSQPVTTIHNNLDCTHLYALGWFVENYQGQQFFWHTGGWPGTSILVGLIPSKNFGFVMMSNTNLGGTFLHKTLYQDLIHRVLGLPIPPPNVKYPQKPKDQETSAEAVRRLFKSVSPDHPPVPLALPLDAFQGTYTHPAYGSLTFKLVEGGNLLHADCTAEENHVLPTSVDLSHVSASFFLADLCESGWRSAYYAAEFHVAASGKPDKLGIGLEPALGEGEYIWFERV